MTKRSIGLVRNGVRLLRPLGPRRGRSSALAVLTVALGAAAGAMLPGDAGSPSAIAAPRVSATGPEVAIVATRLGAELSSLYIARIGATAVPAPVATFPHAADACVRATVLPGTSTVLVIADVATTRDLSFAGSLVRLVPHAPPVTLCDRVAHASRPLVTEEGRVFVARGTPGPEPQGPRPSFRVDDLTIDEVDPASGATRTVHAFPGQLTFLAGSLGHEVVVYRIGPGGADIVGIDADSGHVRSIAASLLPFARDFSIDPTSRSLVLEERSETDSMRWVIDRMDLATGARTRLYEGARYALAPHVWPGGAIAYNPDAGRGIALLGGAPLGAPLGDGVDLVLDVERGGGAVALLHTVPSTLPVPFAITPSDARPKAIPAPAGARVTIAGFVTAAGGT